MTLQSLSWFRKTITIREPGFILWGGGRDDAHTRSKRHPGHWSSFGDQIWFIVEISFSQNIATVPTAISHYYHHCQCHHQGERRNAVVALEWCVLCQEEEGGDLIARRVSPLYNDHCTGLDSASDWEYWFCIVWTITFSKNYPKVKAAQQWIVKNVTDYSVFLVLMVGGGLNDPQLPKTREVFVSRQFWVHFCPMYRGSRWILMP